MSVDGQGKARIAPVSEFGWAGCWACQHRLAVCPTGTISIFGRAPEDSLSTPKPEEEAPVLDALLATRRACRRYLPKDVPMETIGEMPAIPLWSGSPALTAECLIPQGHRVLGAWDCRQKAAGLPASGFVDALIFPEIRERAIPDHPAGKCAGLTPIADGHGLITQAAAHRPLPAA